MSRQWIVAEHIGANAMRTEWIGGKLRKNRDNGKWHCVVFQGGRKVHTTPEYYARQQALMAADTWVRQNYELTGRMIVSN